MNKVVYSSDYMFELSNKAIEWLNSHGKTKDWCYEAAVNYTLRTDPILIECIETLGTEADTKSSSLRIAKIEGDTYTIFDNGTSEYVLTPENLKWLTIK